MRGGVWSWWRCSVAWAWLGAAGGRRLESSVSILLCGCSISLVGQSRVFSDHHGGVKLRAFTLSLLLCLRGVDHSWRILPVCKSFSKPMLCSPLIRAAPLVPCIISRFREKSFDGASHRRNLQRLDRHTDPFSGCRCHRAADFCTQQAAMNKKGRQINENSPKR